MFDLSKLFNFFYLIRQNIKSNLFDLFAHLYVKIYFFILLIINIIIWLTARFIDTEIGEELIALHYNVDFGINLIGEAKKIYIIPLLGFLIIIINFIIFGSIGKYRGRVFIFYILFAASLLANIILLMAITSIYLINFR